MVNIKLKLINENFLGLEDIKRIYEEAFPKDEIVPLDIVLLLAKEGLAKIFAICEDNSLIGFISILLGDKLVYGLHLAIDSTLRGKGYGTKTLELLKEKTEGKPLFYSVEPLDENAINYNQRVKRVKLYERLGFKFYDMKMNMMEEPMDVMGADGLSHDLILNEFEIIFSRIMDFAVKNKDLILDCYKRDNFDLEYHENLLNNYENNKENIEILLKNF